MQWVDFKGLKSTNFVLNHVSQTDREWQIMCGWTADDKMSTTWLDVQNVNMWCPVGKGGERVNRYKNGV